MTRCLSERVLLLVATGDASLAAHRHVQLCADCAERYDLLREDLMSIGDTLSQAPPRRVLASRSATMLVRWLPAAAAAMVLLGVGMTVTRLLTPAPLRVATRSATVSDFAADVSDAVFATGDTGVGTQVAFDAPYLRAALEAGLPCTGERFFNGQCTDPDGALLELE